ncbi:hypothetical protein [Sporolactobacillus spathodeae]|uniref:Bacteriorhodopsin n=1 Tax=Sporolactobacillus spathodeae TaxID=1465502 RepID=A0ABS2QA67_9BACL|nr:hypothetical protein [Sporolactobacillus spathodeae]MBM7658511.1 bacteriorhodopsin [Sporolactobacillus spathodeae]
MKHKPGFYFLMTVLFLVIGIVQTISHVTFAFLFYFCAIVFFVQALQLKKKK